MPKRQCLWTIKFFQRFPNRRVTPTLSTENVIGPEDPRLALDEQFKRLMGQKHVGVLCESVDFSSITFVASID